MTDKRLTDLNRWLSNIAGSGATDLAPASEDASFRRYFRVQIDGQSRIVMDAPPPQENCAPFVEVAGFLSEMGLNAPALLSADIENGFLLLSDLGERQYLAELSEHPESADDLYQDAMRALQAMQSKGIQFQDRLPPYDKKMLMFEASLFHDWLCERHLGLTFNKYDERQWAKCRDAVVKNALDQPTVFVHRDYHSRNLMFVPNNNPGILDFQDSVAGPFTYDLVSLLKDCYVRWPENQVYDWVSGFYAMLDTNVKATVTRDTFQRYFDLAGVQRHLKAAGIFARLLHRDGKTGYMKDVPRTLQYIVDVGRRYPEIGFLATLIEERCLPALGQPE